MRKNKSIENVARIIVNRVKYHAPIIYDDDIDFEILENFGIDTSLPIFKFEKEMSKPLLHAFKLAKKIVNFNLVTSHKTKSAFALFLPNQTPNLRLLQMINKLNINYKTNSSFQKIEEEDFLKFNGKELNLQFDDFTLVKHANIDGILVKETRFVCSGECIMIELSNSNSKQNEIAIKYHKNLPQGYYFFKKRKSSIEVQNLFSKDTKFFNTNLNKNDIYFSCVDGVESSTCACISFCQKVTLKPYQRKCFFINFGNACFSVKNQTDMEELLNLSRKKCYENFNVKVFSIDKDFDNTFNIKMPREIWVNWINGKRNAMLEDEYVNEKEKIVLIKNKRVEFVSLDYKKFREIDVFDGKKFREVFINNFSNENALVIGKTKFQNLKSFCLDKIQSKTQICLHFK